MQLICVTSSIYSKASEREIQNTQGAHVSATVPQVNNNNKSATTVRQIIIVSLCSCIIIRIVQWIVIQPEIISCYETVLLPDHAPLRPLSPAGIRNERRRNEKVLSTTTQQTTHRKQRVCLLQANCLDATLSSTSKRSSLRDNEQQYVYYHGPKYKYQTDEKTVAAVCSFISLSH